MNSRQHTWLNLSWVRANIGRWMKFGGIERRGFDFLPWFTSVNLMNLMHLTNLMNLMNLMNLINLINLVNLMNLMNLMNFMNLMNLMNLMNFMNLMNLMKFLNLMNLMNLLFFMNLIHLMNLLNVMNERQLEFVLCSLVPTFDWCWSQQHSGGNEFGLVRLPNYMDCLVIIRKFNHLDLTEEWNVSKSDLKLLLVKRSK